MFHVITIKNGQEYHSSDFRHRHTGYATYAEAERWADTIAQQNMAVSVFVVNTDTQERTRTA